MYLKLLPDQYIAQLHLYMISPNETPTVNVAIIGNQVVFMPIHLDSDMMKMIRTTDETITSQPKKPLI